MSSSEEHSSDMEMEDHEKDTTETSAETDDVEAGKDLTPRTKEHKKASSPLNRSRIISGMENATPLKGEKGGDQSRTCWQATVLPFKWFGRKYPRVRDWIIRTFFSFAILTTPLLGPLTWHWWSIDINILELICVAGIFAGATIGGSGAKYGIATGIMTCIVLLPVARNNFIKYLFGIPFEKMIKYHRWAGYYLMVPLSMHAIMEGGFIDDYTDITGTVAWIAAGLMLITSFYLFRRYKFEFFWLTHFLFLVYIGASIAHKQLIIGFVVPGGIMYAIDVILRLLRYWTRSSKAVSITQFDESMCKIEVPKTFNYKAGQYAFVLVPRVSRLQWHPISFSSAPQEQTMSFHIRDLGSWSRGINRLSEEDLCTIKVDGPYGKVGIPYKKYKVLALFAAGAGVTPMMSVLKDIYLRRQMNQRCKVEKVHFYWSAGKAGALEWFAEDLAFMAQHPLENLDLQMNIYVARMNKLHIQSESAQQVPLSKGRNDIKSNFKSLKEENKGETIGVLICGPKRFDYEVRKNCLIQSWTWPWTTKFHYHHETFAF